ncbi:myosin-IIIa [Arapaima gigas]
MLVGLGAFLYYTSQWNTSVCRNGYCCVCFQADSTESTHHPRETTNMRTQTVASYFRYSLMDLLSKMVAGQPHFVRCIKPNNDRQANKFDREKVLVQLRYTGILETAKIRRQGYSHRILFANFIKRYAILAFRANEEPTVSVETCAVILEKAKLDNWALGKTKVFLKYYHVEQLNLMVRRMTDRVVLVQACVRGWLGARRYRKMLEKREHSAVVLQSAYRGYKVRKEVTDDKNKAKMEAYVVSLQAVCRGYLARKKCKELIDEKNKAAVKIQAHYRGHRQRKSFQKKKEAVQKEKQEKLEMQEEAPTENESSLSEETIQPPQRSDSDKDETKAAVVLQSNYRGYRERKKLKEQQQSKAGQEIVEDAQAVLDTEDLQPEEEANTEEDTTQEEGCEDAGAGAGLEQETKAATVIQSNFRGHRERKKLEEEGKIPHRAKGTKNPEQGGQSAAAPAQPPAEEAKTKTEEEEAKAAVVIQSNFRGHKERKRLQEEGKIPRKTEAVKNEPSEAQNLVPESDLNGEEDGKGEEKAAVVLQSNFRGYRERKRLKEEKDGKKQLETGTEEPLELNDVQMEQDQPVEYDESEEERAAIKIQSNFRGYKDRKNLKMTAGKEMEDLEYFSKEISRASENYLALQKKLNEIILAHQMNPANNGMFMKGRQINGYAAGHQAVDSKQTRTSRRTQKPKTLNTPEDSTYYNLIHRSVQDDKRRPRKQSKSAPSISGESPEPNAASSSERNRSSERPASEPGAPKPSKEKRHSLPRMPSMESESDDNPYDYRKLLRKTSQRQRLIKQH